MAIQTGIYLIMLLNWISLMIGDTEQLSHTCWPSVCFFFFWSVCIQVLFPLFKQIDFLLFSCMSFLYILGINPLLNILFVNIFFHCVVAFSFCWLILLLCFFFFFLFCTVPHFFYFWCHIFSAQTFTVSGLMIKYLNYFWVNVHDWFVIGILIHSAENVYPVFPK